MCTLIFFILKKAPLEFLTFNFKLKYFQFVNDFRFLEPLTGYRKWLVYIQW